MISSTNIELIKCPKCDGEDVFYNPFSKFCYCSECEFNWTQSDQD